MGPTIINKSAELVSSLQRGLEIQEQSRVGDQKAQKDLQTWQREVKSRLPAGSTFKARAFHFAYTDAKRIRKFLLSTSGCKYAEETGDDIECPSPSGPSRSTAASAPCGCTLASSTRT